MQLTSCMSVTNDPHLPSNFQSALIKLYTLWKQQQQKKYSSFLASNYTHSIWNKEFLQQSDLQHKYNELIVKCFEVSELMC